MSMKGLEELAKACAPETQEPAPAAAAVNLTDEQIDKIAARMIEKLQTKQPEPEEEKSDQETDPGNDQESEDLGEEDT